MPTSLEWMEVYYTASQQHQNESNLLHLMWTSLECAQLYSLDMDLVIENATNCTSYNLTRRTAILMHLNKPMHVYLVNRTSTSLEWGQLCCTRYQPTEVCAQHIDPTRTTPVIMHSTSTSLECVQLYSLDIALVIVNESSTNALDAYLTRVNWSLLYSISTLPEWVQTCCTWCQHTRMCTTLLTVYGPCHRECKQLHIILPYQKACNPNAIE